MIKCMYPMVSTKMNYIYDSMLSILFKSPKIFEKWRNQVYKNFVSYYNSFWLLRKMVRRCDIFVTLCILVVFKYIITSWYSSSVKWLYLPTFYWCPYVYFIYLFIYFIYLYIYYFIYLLDFILQRFIVHQKI